MAEHRITLRMRPPGLTQKIWYRRMDTTPPLMESRDTAADLARLLPYGWRRFHRWYANTCGYYWLPCVLCDRPYGGHEAGGSIPDPTRGEHSGVMVCSVCFRKRAG